MLIAHFLERYGADELAVSAAATRRLVQYPWPGNVRELRNVVRAVVALSTSWAMVQNPGFTTQINRRLSNHAGPGRDNHLGHTGLRRRKIVGKNI